MHLFKQLNVFERTLWITSVTAIIVSFVLWVLASVTDASYIPMVVCFVMFLANDLYGFFNWRKMAKLQKMS